MKSYITSYNGLFERPTGDAPAVQRIEIPIIQRDYAQGRDSGTVARIRANFLDALHNALTTATPISLDFVYGDVVNGTLRPLDGQQRDDQQQDEQSVGQHPVKDRAVERDILRIRSIKHPGGANIR